MKLMTATLCLCVLCSGALASDKPDRKLALEYLQAARMEQTMNSSIDAMVSSMYPNANEKEKGEFRAIIEQTVGWEASKEQLLAITTEVYTKQELKAAITFMKSKAGASMTAKNETFSKLYAEQMAANLQKFISSYAPPAAAAPASTPNNAKP